MQAQAGDLTRARQLLDTSGRRRVQVLRWREQQSSGLIKPVNLICATCTSHASASPLLELLRLS